MVSNTPTYSGLKTYETLALVQRLVAYGSDGTFVIATPDQNNLTPLLSGLPAACWMESCTVSGAEYCAISDGMVGTFRPMQYNDQTGLIDPVSQEGPGSAPSAADTAGIALNISAAVNSVTCANNTVTITVTTAVSGAWVGHYIAIAGVTDGTFNTTNPVVITAVNVAANQISYAFTHANGTSASGTATIGSSAIGIHQVAFFYITRNAYWTKMSPAFVWNTAGFKQITVTVPTGPPNVVARGVACTTAGGARFFHLGDRMLLQDNVTATITFDFDDVTLASGLSVDYLNLQEVVQPSAFTIPYSSRLVWIGERNHLQGFRNLSWMGGPGGLGTPAGWTGVVTASLPVTLYNQSPHPACLQLLGTAGSANPTTITQPANVDAWFGVQLLQTRTPYTVRAWVKRDAGLVAGQLAINLVSASLGLSTGGLTLNAAVVTTNWVEYTGTLVDAVSLTAVPADLLLQVSTILTPTANKAFYLGPVSIYPTLEPRFGSRVRISRAGNLESYDGTLGAIDVDDAPDQELRNGFVQHGFLYLVKERSIHVTSDDGINEPDNWALEMVSPTVGTPSPHGIAVADNWVFICCRTGLYLFYGGRARLISSEITSLWQSANWDSAGQTVWISNNEKKRRVLVGLPMNGATQPNLILALYYNDFDDPLQTLLTDPLENDGRGRKWSPWNISARSGAVIESPSGPRDFLGNGLGNGKIWELKDGQRSDNDGATAINSYYDTAFLGNPGYGRSLFGYASTYVFGSGTAIFWANYPNYSQTLQICKRSLQAVPAADPEMPLNVLGNRISFRIQTNAIGDWVSCAKFVPYVKQDPWAPLKGR